MCYACIIGKLYTTSSPCTVPFCKKISIALYKLFLQDILVELSSTSFVLFITISLVFLFLFWDDEGTACRVVNIKIIITALCLPSKIYTKKRELLSPLGEQVLLGTIETIKILHTHTLAHGQGRKAGIFFVLICATSCRHLINFMHNDIKLREFTKSRGFRAHF